MDADELVQSAAIKIAGVTTTIRAALTNISYARVPGPAHLVHVVGHAHTRANNARRWRPRHPLRGMRGSMTISPTARTSVRARRRPGCCRAADSSIGQGAAPMRRAKLLDPGMVPGAAIAPDVRAGSRAALRTAQARDQRHDVLPGRCGAGRTAQVRDQRRRMCRLSGCLF